MIQSSKTKFYTHIHMHITLYSKSSFSFVKLLRKNHFLRFSYSHFCTNPALLTTFASQLYFIPCHHFLFNTKTSYFFLLFPRNNCTTYFAFLAKGDDGEKKICEVCILWFNCLKGIILSLTPTLTINCVVYC